LLFLGVSVPVPGLVPATAPAPNELAYFKAVVHNTSIIPLIMDGVLDTPIALPTVTTDVQHWQQDTDAISAELISLNIRMGQSSNCIAKLTAHYTAAARIQLVPTVTCAW
jgi:hypothetical protein